MPTPLGLYKFNEAASGTSPQVLIDTAYNDFPVNLGITYGASGQWTSIAAGRGLSLAGSAGNGGLKQGLTNTKYQKAYSGATTLTLTVVADTSTAGATTRDLGGIANTGGQIVVEMLHLNTNTSWAVNIIDGAGVATANYTPGLHVFTVVVDTSQATAANRLKLYLDGVLQTLTGTPTFPPQNTVLDNVASNWAINTVVLGQFTINLQPMNGILYGAAFYAAALAASDVAAESTAWLANNDVSPDGPTITSWLAPQTVGEGTTATFNVVATGAGTVHYQWKLNGSNVGTDSSSYTTATLTMADSGSTVQCVVTDNNGSTSTNLAYLTVVPLPHVAWLGAA